MASLKCPWCGNPYLITDTAYEIPVAREAYQEHLNNGCNPTLGFTISKMTSLQQFQKDAYEKKT